MSFEVEASGTPPLAYQWFWGDTAGTSNSEIQGATNSVFALSSAYGAVRLSVEVQDRNGFAVSEPITVQPVSPPLANVASSQRMGGALFMSVTNGDSVTLRNSYQLPELTDLEVQWLFDGAPLDGAKGENLLLDRVGANDAGIYTYCARSRFGTNQDSVWLIVASEPPSPNAPILTSWPQNTVLTNGDSVQLDVGAEGAAPLTFQWFYYYSGTNSFAISTNRTLRLNQVSTSSAYSVAVANRFGVAYSPRFEVNVSGSRWRTSTYSPSSAGTGELKSRWLTLNGKPGKKYRCEISDDLISWLPFGNLPVGSVTSFNLLLSSGRPRFIRAEELKP